MPTGDDRLGKHQQTRSGDDPCIDCVADCTHFFGEVAARCAAAGIAQGRKPHFEAKLRMEQGIE